MDVDHDPMAKRINAAAQQACTSSVWLSEQLTERVELGSRSQQQDEAEGDS